MADVGTENYDQEFTLGLIENEQGTLELVNEALARLEKGKFGCCVECGEAIAKPRLQAIPYTRHCIECARTWRTADDARSLGSAAGCSSGRSRWAGPRSTWPPRPWSSTESARRQRAPVPLVAGVLELQTSHQSRRPLGLRPLFSAQQLDLRRPFHPRRAGDLLLAVRPSAPPPALSLTIALGLIMAGAMGNCYDRLVFGHVRDFVHFHVDSIGFDCAIFNFADNLLVAGAISLVLFALRPEPAPAHPEPGTVAEHVRPCPEVTP